jgi:diguanylate cyclase (GGDEF)-like protein
MRESAPTPISEANVWTRHVRAERGVRPREGRVHISAVRASAAKGSSMGQRGKNAGGLSAGRESSVKLASAARDAAAAPHEQAVLSRVESIAYLPTSVAVAMKFVELGRDPDANPADYAKVISSDSSLSSKLLSLANSSWFGVRNRVTKIPVALNLLGLGTVRTLAISYCVTGLHHELKLRPEESRVLWEAALCKAVAAKTYASLFDAKLADEAFVAGLFQDFALPIMYACARDEMRALLADKSLNWAGRLARERELFHLDHAELGRSLAQKLDLPDLYVDAVAFHHHAEKLSEFMHKPALAEAAHVAALFPHLLEAWNGADASELRGFLAPRLATVGTTTEAFLASVQGEFNTLYAYFERGEAPGVRLDEMLARASQEVAENTTRLVATVQELMQQAANQGREISLLISQQNQTEEEAARDALTGALNRAGFIARAEDLLAKALRYGSSFALAYLDIDNFKDINDSAGHAAGDAALRKVVGILAGAVRQSDLVGRLGGDEFVLLLRDCSRTDAVTVLERIIARTAQEPAALAGARPMLSVGLIWAQLRGGSASLEKLLATADALMYEAKRAGGNQLRWSRAGSWREPRRRFSLPATRRGQIVAGRRPPLRASRARRSRRQTHGSREVTSRRCPGEAWRPRRRCAAPASRRHAFPGRPSGRRRRRARRGA